MAKGKGRAGLGKGMLDQIQRMQEELEQAQQSLAEETVTASAGGGAVQITMSGTQECRAVHIAQNLLDESDREMVQDLVLLAVNQAIRDSQVLAARKLGPMTDGLKSLGLGG
jgi:DNA-binding YbaB/EbfC family protein